MRPSQCHGTQVTIITPTLNEAGRVQRLGAAIAAQSLGGVEWVLSDGGSTDNTVELARALGASVVCGPAGVSRQRNAGAAVANGELLVFMDADCLPDPRFVERVAVSYRRLPFAVACPWFVARDAGPLVGAFYCLFNLAFWLGQGTVRTGSGVCIITPRRVFERLGGFDEAMHLGEDICYIRRAAPRFGLHRHLLVPLETSGRRFQSEGPWRLMMRYALMSPLILLGRWSHLQRVQYAAAPYASPGPGEADSAEGISP